MAEWLMRGTVNTFFSGSNPLDAFYCVFNIALTLRAPFGLPPLPPASEAGRWGKPYNPSIPSLGPSFAAPGRKKQPTHPASFARRAEHA